MVSTNLILETGLQPALLALFSGTLLNRERWTQLADAHPGCQVLQSHGDQDLLLPREPAIDLSQLLSNAGFQVEFLTFRGPHTIPMQVLSRFRERLEEVVERL
jgi:phospholipase/carboxylesterase